MNFENRTIIKRDMAKNVSEGTIYNQIFYKFLGEEPQTTPPPAPRTGPPTVNIPFPGQYPPGYGGGGATDPSVHGHWHARVY